MPHTKIADIINLNVQASKLNCARQTKGRAFCNEMGGWLYSILSLCVAVQIIDIDVMCWYLLAAIDCYCSNKCHPFYNPRITHTNFTNYAKINIAPAIHSSYQADCWNPCAQNDIYTISTLNLKWILRDLNAQHRISFNFCMCVCWRGFWGT